MTRAAFWLAGVLRDWAGRRLVADLEPAWEEAVAEARGEADG